MLEPIADAPAGVLALKAVGRVDGADYESVLTPAIEAAVAERGKIRIVLELGSEFEGYSPAAAWEDLKL